jgi:hypothetical protein
MIEKNLIGYKGTKLSKTSNIRKSRLEFLRNDHRETKFHGYKIYILFLGDGY